LDDETLVYSYLTEPMKASLNLLRMRFASPPIANNLVTCATRKQAMCGANNEVRKEFVTPWKVDLIDGRGNMATGGVGFVNLEKLLTAPDGWRSTSLGRD